jgi:parallel beta-helix repeat protein
MSRRKALIIAAAAILAVCAAVTAVLATGGSPKISPHYGTTAGQAPASPTPICGQPVLNSVWNYNGPPGTYNTSGTPAGLPTFGAPGTDFPGATSVMVVAAGNNTAAASAGTFKVNHEIVYFEPGEHIIQSLMFAGYDAAYVGGYTPAAGKAVIDGVDGATNGTGLGGSAFAASQNVANNATDNTWEYLTIKNYTTGRGGSVMGFIDGTGAWDNGDTYKYDTIGPNDYGFVSTLSPPRTGESSGGGYALTAASFNTIEYNCISHDAEGGVNISDAVDTRILHNEFSWNGIGEYPDTSGTGQSPFACGCSAGLGKIFYSVNTDIIGNYVHDNYNYGIWVDTNEAGDNISGNYIASNWAGGIFYESSYNANISDNTLTGNAWASDGAWPPGHNGGLCDGFPCQDGLGIVGGGSKGLAAATIYLPNSGGDSALSTVSIPSTITVPGCASACTVTSRYSGHLYVTGNKMLNNFGGILTYSDTSRFPAETTQNQSCDEPLGSLHQPNSVTYYNQYNLMLTNADTAISGVNVTSTHGTEAYCNSYFTPSAPGKDVGYSFQVTNPLTGMDVFDQTTGTLLGTVATVTSAQSFTLNQAPSGGYTTGDVLWLQSPGGCGFPDYPPSGSPGQVSGTPPAAYWDHCLWGSRNVTISGNYFSVGASTVTNCTQGNGCGFMQITGFNAGIAAINSIWTTMPTLMQTQASGLNITWSGNAYHWQGTGGWSFHAGFQGAPDLTQAQWLTAGQDAGSTFGT